MRTTVFSFIIATALLSGCSSSDPAKFEVSENEVTIKRGQTYQIIVSGAEDVNFTSENDFHAEVDQTGKIKSNFAGKTIVKASTVDASKDIKVTVEPDYTLFKDPIVDFNKTREDIIKELGEPLEDHDKILHYYQSEEVPLILYQFDAQNMLSVVGAFISTTQSENLNKHLNERYKFERSQAQNGSTSFRNTLNVDDATMSVVRMPFGDSLISVIYEHYNEERRRQIKELEASGGRRGVDNRSN
jgi:hypothetical protein